MYIIIENRKVGIAYIKTSQYPTVKMYNQFIDEERRYLSEHYNFKSDLDPVVGFLCLGWCDLVLLYNFKCLQNFLGWESRIINLLEEVTNVRVTEFSLSVGYWQYNNNKKYNSIGRSFHLNEQAFTFFTHLKIGRYKMRPNLTYKNIIKNIISYINETNFNLIDVEIIESLSWMEIILVLSFPLNRLDSFSRFVDKLRQVDGVLDVVTIVGISPKRILLTENKFDCDIHIKTSRLFTPKTLINKFKVMKEDFSEVIGPYDYVIYGKYSLTDLFTRISDLRADNTIIDTSTRLLFK